MAIRNVPGKPGPKPRPRPDVVPVGKKEAGELIASLAREHEELAEAVRREGRTYSKDGRIYAHPLVAMRDGTAKALLSAIRLANSIPEAPAPRPPGGLVLDMEK